MITEWLMLISLWCKADPYPFKTVHQCREQLTQCVRSASSFKDKSNCFGPAEDLSWPDWKKEVAR